MNDIDESLGNCISKGFFLPSELRYQFHIDEISHETDKDPLHQIEWDDARSHHSTDIFYKIRMVDDDAVHRQQDKVVQHGHHYGQGDDADSKADDQGLLRPMPFVDEIDRKQQ